MAALIYHGLPDLNWAGFYFRRDDELVLGPFQGKPACVRIPWGQGVCGTAAARGNAVIVPDVHEFPGHIACDPASRSELVVPLVKAGEVAGVLDLDSPVLARFDEEDRTALRAPGCDPDCVAQPAMTASPPFARRARVTRRIAMEIGASIFFTDYSITPAELGVAMEERGFDLVWAAEHSHIPVPRRTRADHRAGEALLRCDGPVRDADRRGLRDQAAQARDRHRLVIQRDTIQTAKLVASIDQVSAGRFIFGIGGGWNQEEIENHDTVFATRMQKMREQIEAMKEIWTKPKPEYHGDIVEFDTMMTWPKPVQKPYPPIILGGAFPWAARRAVAMATAGTRTRRAATPRNTFRPSARWPRKPGATRNPCHYALAARRTISTS